MVSDNSTIPRTYRIKRKTAARLKALATRLAAFESPLVDLLLDRALTEVENGNWPLQKEPVKFIVKW